MNNAAVSLLQQTYLSLSILSVDGNNAVHVGTIFAGLSDTDIDNFPKITIRLQVLVRKYNSVIEISLAEKETTLYILAGVQKY